MKVPKRECSLKRRMVYVLCIVLIMLTVTTGHAPPAAPETTPPWTPEGPIAPFGSTRVHIHILSTSDHAHLRFLGEETLEQLDDIHIEEGAELISAGGWADVDPVEKMVGFGAPGQDSTTIISIDYSVGLFNLKWDTSILLRLEMGCIGWTYFAIFNHNLAEYLHVDARNTTICDGVHYSLSDNAFLTDTDGDGLGDGDEVLIHGTSPTTDDTDGDGISDPTEIEAGTDPKDPTDYPTLTTPEMTSPSETTPPEITTAEREEVLFIPGFSLEIGLLSVLVLGVLRKYRRNRRA